MRCRVCLLDWKFRPRSARPFPICVAAFPAHAGSIPKIITSPCASSAISTACRRMKSPRMLFRVNRKPFEVKVQGLHSFGGKKPRAVVASVEPSRPLIELQAELERLMQRLGLDPEGRKFTPHVTLARLHDASSQDVADYLSVRGYFPSRTFHGVALRAVLVARLHRRRALCGRGFLRAERVRRRRPGGAQAKPGVCNRLSTDMPGLRCAPSGLRLP